MFCPKLCRSACPVSNAEPRETLTPWGKMSTAYFIANESVADSPSFASPSWACTGCFGCREHCDHHNDVTGTLFDARSAIVETRPDAAPEGATRVLSRAEGAMRAMRSIADDPRVRDVVDASASVAVLVGCQAARARDDAAFDTIRATSHLVGAKVAVADDCCGAPLLYAGDQRRFAAQGERFVASMKGRDRVIVGDAGCAAALRLHHHERGRAMPVPVLHFAELAGRELGKLGHVRELAEDGPVRWHDPCQLGRGLGVYDAPRNLLARALGRAPEEFERRREDARCSGAGGLLPVTMPDVARTIAHQRVADHERSGGGTIVTACASSKKSFVRAGARVLDLATVVLRALEAHPERGTDRA